MSSAALPSSRPRLSFALYIFSSAEWHYSSPSSLRRTSTRTRYVATGASQINAQQKTKTLVLDDAKTDMSAGLSSSFNVSAAWGGLAINERRRHAQALSPRRHWSDSLLTPDSTQDVQGASVVHGHKGVEVRRDEQRLRPRAAQPELLERPVGFGGSPVRVEAPPAHGFREGCQLPAVGRKREVTNERRVAA